MFKESLTFIEGQTAIQSKRQMDYDKVHKEISDLEQAGMITENKSTKLSNLCNLVVIQKSERLSKAVKSIQSEVRRKNKKLNIQPTEPTEVLKYRCTLDLTDTNRITIGQKFVNLTSVDDLLQKVKDKYVSKFDLFNFSFL